MSFIAWMAAIGVLLLTMSLAAGWIRRLPITTYAIYLLVGLAASPLWLNLIDIHIQRDAAWLERLTELALIVSLFIGGLKLRVPLRNHLWRTAALLASVTMVLTVAGVAVCAHLLLDLNWPLSLLLGAVLAPTDPVLASQVSVNDASDHDALRVSLSGEAGLNDGSAKPLLLLALILLQQDFSWPTVGHWLALDVLFAIPAGLLVGWVLGWGVGRIGARLYSAMDTRVPGDLLTLALIFVAYAAAESIHALGFLAVFAAGFGLRQAEVFIVDKASDGVKGSAASHAPAEASLQMLPEEDAADHDLTHTMGRMVRQALSFGDTLERLLGTLLVLLLGVVLVHHWTPVGLLIAALLFVLVRPAAVWLSTMGLALPWQRRALIGWLGIRGIGSLNYVTYALVHGLHGRVEAPLIVGVVLTVVASSVAVHGISAQPLLAWRRRALHRSGRG